MDKYDDFNDILKIYNDESLDEKKKFFLVNQVDARKNFFHELPALRAPVLTLL